MDTVGLKKKKTQMPMELSHHNGGAVHSQKTKFLPPFTLTLQITLNKEFKLLEVLLQLAPQKRFLRMAMIAIKQRKRILKSNMIVRNF